MKKSRASSGPSHHSLPRFSGARSSRRPKFSKAWLEAVKLSPFTLQASCAISPRVGCIAVERTGMPFTARDGTTNAFVNMQYKSQSLSILLPDSSRLFLGNYVEDNTDYSDALARPEKCERKTPGPNYRRIVTLKYILGTLRVPSGVLGPAFNDPFWQNNPSQGGTAWGRPAGPHPCDGGEVENVVEIGQENNLAVPPVRYIVGCIRIPPPAFFAGSSGVPVGSNPVSIGTEIEKDRPHAVILQFRVRPGTNPRILQFTAQAFRKMGATTHSISLPVIQWYLNPTGQIP